MPDMLSLYDALAAVDVTLDAAVVPVFNLDTLPGAPQTAQLPCRLLLPLSARGSGSSTPITFSGARLRIDWTIIDLFLYRPVGQGRGISTAAPVLARYLSAYADALRAQVALLDGVTLARVTLEPGVYAYPDGGPSFYGVEAALTLADVREA